MIDSDERLKNSALAKTYKIEKVAANYDISIKLTSGLEVAIINKEFLITFGAKNQLV